MRCDQSRCRSSSAKEPPPDTTENLRKHCDSGLDSYCVKLIDRVNSERKNDYEDPQCNGVIPRYKLVSGLAPIFETTG